MPEVTCKSSAIWSRFLSQITQCRAVSPKYDVYRLEKMSASLRESLSLAKKVAITTDA